MHGRSRWQERSMGQEHISMHQSLHDPSMNRLINKGVGGAILVADAPEIERAEGSGELDIANAAIGHGVVGAARQAVVAPAVMAALFRDAGGVVAAISICHQK